LNIVFAINVVDFAVVAVITAGVVVDFADNLKVKNMCKKKLKRVDFIGLVFIN
jgi:hypothetical protein